MNSTSPYIDLIGAADCTSLAPRLREADKNEITAATGNTPEEALAASWELSQGMCWGIFDRPTGRVLGVFGVCPYPGIHDLGICWGVSSDELMDKHSVWFLRKGTPTILALQHHFYPKLFNHVDMRNTVHLRWLKWAGFTLGAVHCTGPDNLPFQELYRHV